MRLSRVPVSGLKAGEQTLDTKTAHYLRDVLRLQAGDRFLAFDPESHLEADGTLAERTHEVEACVIGPVRAAAIALDTGIVILQSLAKSDKTEHVVRSATSLGAAEIHLVESGRSVARSGDRSDAKRARFGAVALDAARQSGRGDVPKICGPHPIAHELERWRDTAAIKLCLVPGALRSFRALTQGWTVGSPLVILIGPEGGLTPEELSLSEQVGFTAASFGALVLRTELVGTAVLGALLLLADS